MKQLWVIYVGIFVHGLCWGVDRIPLIIVDAYGQNEHCYRNLRLMADNVGFKTDYKTIYHILENPDLSNYTAALFVLTPSMLDQSLIQNASARSNEPFSVETNIAQFYMNAVVAFAQRPHTSIGFLLSNNAYSPELQQYAQKALAQLMQGASLSENALKALDQFIIYITQRDILKGTLFGTSLANPGNSALAPCIDTAGNPLKAIHDSITNECIAQTMPLASQEFDPLVQRALPNAMLFKNSAADKIYLVSKTSEFDFAEVTENFFKNPLPLIYRTQLLHAVQKTLQAFHSACSTHMIPHMITHTPALPRELTASYLRSEHQRIMEHRRFDSQHVWLTKNPPSCGCIEYDDLFGYEDSCKKLRALLDEKMPNPDPRLDMQKEVERLALCANVEMIYDARFSCIWLGCVSEWYLAKGGMRADQKAKYLQNLRKFAHQIRAVFISQGVPMPKIFIGMNITSNFRNETVKNPVVDLYGRVYPHIPCPFDVVNVWFSEVLQVFTVLCDSLGDILPIDGVFFDFEMYHAQKEAGAYTELMDFSHLAWQVYCLYGDDKSAKQIATVQERVAYLQREKKFDAYFDALERASRDLGSALKNNMRKRVPKLMFAAYAPTLPSSWFYRGMYAGLSNSRDPLLLATFNTDYASHHDWLLQHNIYLLHGSAVLLSKLQRAEDFNLITQLVRHHDFIWYNRSSRMIYEYTQKELDSTWWGIEASTYNRAAMANSLRMHHMAPLQKR